MARSAVNILDDNDSGEMEVYLAFQRLVDRMHRRMLDVVRSELAKGGIMDISPVQAMTLLTIGRDEISVRELIVRGYYLSSNASYNLKQLQSAGYIERAVAENDKRSARLKLSPKGQELCSILARRQESFLDRLLSESLDGPAELERHYKILRRIERAWSEALREDEDIF